MGGLNGSILNELTLIACVCVYVNGEAAGTIEAFGAVRACMSSPAVRLLVSRNWRDTVVCAKVTLR